MQAAVVSVLGQPPRYQSFPDPEPEEGEALIQVRAAGLHPIVKGLAAEQPPLAIALRMALKALQK